MFPDESEPELEGMASVFGEFNTPSLKGAIGVIGPRRMRYEVIIPNVRYFTELIESAMQK